MNVCWKQASWEEQVKEIPMASVSGVLKMGQAFACYAVKGVEAASLLLWFQACRVKGLFGREQLRKEKQTAAVCFKFKACVC